MSEKKKKHHGLQHRWLVNTFGVIFALGLVCVSAVTASYAAYYYSLQSASSPLPLYAQQSQILL